jgi:hypothetical protein
MMSIVVLLRDVLHLMCIVQRIRRSTSEVQTDHVAYDNVRCRLSLTRDDSRIMIVGLQLWLTPFSGWMEVVDFVFVGTFTMEGRRIITVASVVISFSLTVL